MATLEDLSLHSFLIFAEVKEEWKSEVINEPESPFSVYATVYSQIQKELYSLQSLPTKSNISDKIVIM